MSSSWWGNEEAASGSGNNVVERVAVPSVEEPNTWNSCITDPREQESSQV